VIIVHGNPFFDQRKPKTGSSWGCDYPALRGSQVGATEQPWIRDGPSLFDPSGLTVYL